MVDVEKLTKDTIGDGGVLALLYFDIHAKDKEAVQQLGAGFVKHILENPGVAFALGEIDEPMEGVDGQNASSSIEVKLLTKDFTTLANICMENSPFTVEILRPDTIELPLSQAHNLLSNISATTAEYKRTIITKVASPQEIAEFQKQMKARAEMGKKILEKKEGD
uniref:Uncharacterized protein n=1 Tax=Candidatus Methanophaga sp. ANME-1 ERB7 TaxID=2759913 RepID=A0A7G9Z2G3_9EURY|nr:hypothetical protein IPKNHHKO_00024 [Methanosarcinales archaeon ANME-1 ERB7]